MEKLKNIVKYLVILFMLVILFICFNNYIIFGNYKINSFFGNFVLFFNKNLEKDVISFNSDYIDKNKEDAINIKDVSGMFFNENYRLEIKDLNINTLKVISINTDGFLDLLGFSVDIFSGKDVYSYDVDDFFIRNTDKAVLIVNHGNVEKIVIKAIKENYVNIDAGNVVINRIDINNKKDFDDLKKELLYKNFSLLVFIFGICFVFFVLLKTKSAKYISSEKVPHIFLIISVCCGMIFSCLFPLYQIPDELTHINMLYSELGMDINFNDEIHQYGDTLRIVHDSGEKVNKEKYFDFSKKLSIKNNYSVPKITIIRHFPQAIGLIFCELLHCPILISVCFAEFMAVIFYSVCCYYSLRLLPFKREVMMSVMLLPICIQQMGSFSYDVMLLSMCFLFISYFLNLKFIKEKVVLSDIFKVFLMLFVIAIVKIPYILLGLLLVMIPLSKLDVNFAFLNINYDSIKRYRKFVIFILCILFIFAFCGLIIIGKKVYYIRILLAAFFFPKISFRLVFNTLSLYKFGYLRGFTSEFGWLDTHSSIIFSAFSYLCIFIISFINFDRTKKNCKIIKNPFKIWEIFAFYFIACLMIFFIVLSMFDWTVVIMGYNNLDKYHIKEIANLMSEISFIRGVQSRYFIPIIPLILLPIYNDRISNFLLKFNLQLFLILYYIITIGYFLILILDRYWIL